MPPVLTAARPPYGGRLAHKLLLTLLLLSLVPLLLMGAAAYTQARSLLRQQVFSFLSAVAESQGQRLSEATRAGQVLLARQMKAQGLAGKVEQALASPAESSALRQSILAALQEANNPTPYFSQFMVLDLSGRIVVASRQAWQGQTTRLALMGAGAGMQVAGQSSAALLADPVSLAASFEQVGLPANDTPGAGPSFAILSAVPLNGTSGERIATIVGVAESSLVKARMEAGAVYSAQGYFITPSGEAFAPNPYPNSFEKLAPRELAPDQRERILSSLHGSGGRGTLEFQPPGQEPVASAFTWLPDLHAGWAVELPQSQVYSQANNVLLSAAVLVLATFLLMAVCLGWATNSLVSPLRELTDTVQLFADGNWEQRSPVDSRDEVGRLAQTFNTMADDLTGLYRSLEARVAERAMRYRLLSEISQAAVSAERLPDLLEQVAGLIGKHFECARAEIGVWLESRPATGVQPEPFPDDDPDFTYQGAYTAAQKPRGRGAAPSFVSAVDGGGVPGSAGACFAIQSAGREWGRLVLAPQHGVTFDPEVREELQTLANQIAPAIQNFSLRETLQAGLLDQNQRLQAEVTALEARLAEVQTLAAVARALALQQDTSGLYPLLHKQVEQALGPVDFYVALVQPGARQIEIPYLSENGQVTQLPAFPLGEGLTSILIQTGEPLLLAHDVARRALELGAKSTGGASLSWLGVPIRFGESILGAIVVQDAIQEGRFNENHQQLLAAIASQVAVFLRYAALLQNAHRRADRDRQLFEITSKIHRTADMEAILQATVTEVASALGARRGRIEIQVETASPGGRPTEAS